MVIPVGVAGVDAIDVDFNADRAVGRVLFIKMNFAGELFELTADGADHHMADRKLNFGMAIIKIPRHGDFSSN
jgi:hypothetical protein